MMAPGFCEAFCESTLLMMALVKDLINKKSRQNYEKLLLHFYNIIQTAAYLILQLLINCTLCSGWLSGNASVLTTRPPFDVVS